MEADVMKIKGRLLEEKNQGMEGGDERGNSWGVILGKLYISTLCALYEYVRTYSISICDYNAPEKCGRKTKRKKEE